MTSVVAAGNPHTAEAAAAILRAGGNAVDAIIASGLAAFVAEPLLASAGGAGMMTVAPPEDAPAVVDFFSAMPGLGGTPDPATRDFRAVEIDFGAATQVFHVGRASAAAPVALAGLAEASRQFGRLPLAEVVGPAVALAREGAPVSEESAEVFRLLWPINVLDAETAATYSSDGAPPAPGTRHPMPALADLLEVFGARAAAPPKLRGLLLDAFGVAAGGSLTEEDLDAAVPRVTPPRMLELGRWRVATSPRIGGRLVGVIAKRLAGEAAVDEADEVLRVAEGCRAGHRAKGGAPGLGSTTHISVIDAEGGAASMTLTNGEGAGYCLPGTGIQLNNFCGEEDLHPGGFFTLAPGAPLPSMIAPTLARSDEGVLALGSGGANRIRSVVAQVLQRVVAGDDLESAVLAPRVHAEEDAVWLEMAERRDPAAVLHRLHAAFENVYEFPTRAFFFGGVHAVLARHGRFEAFGDPRRGGATRIVRHH
ncbi:MAG TPA: gamma-glutamyltransferase [Polyangiaceae bacterium LLY-WYZ-15_(1-7)]|nr:gamma-glutamyltransferase [Polyangiaceae bacterium LLY-WYZ-15_(1-7)]HJL07195.1 gamma-glutamyltransferase [Polyangiaceae bacterium LLY-WYZ-15_(1-7)]HJL26118.1 gamma-glutamyltransferase [Polyangiaceae bacterium LLY-WYZ-15_(1-7)]HJL28935.1 gamma-glutamyltransferase [Polyangiaceae bacterium LLY-WYZ-15_(1-7)]